VRIRQIKPSWWLDKDLRLRLTAEAREMYVGLWQIADDAGWLTWDVVRIAAELYPYGVGASLLDVDPITARERAVTDWADALERLDPAAPHLIVYECGHAHLPKMAAHQRVGGRPVYTVRDAHARDCARMRATRSHGRVGNGKGTVGNGSNSDGGADAPSEFSEKMAALGVKG